MGMDDADDCGPGGHAWVLAGLEVDGLRLRQTRECSCGAVEWVPSVRDYGAGTGEGIMESRQPSVVRRVAQDDMG